mmetsp:Transcript_18067/g.36660  ORF Transcript_18067/g.36660 Transcript_18067/m.36660 type:complete len:222 (-) Transcript_18067:642-1307(-)
MFLRPVWRQTPWMDRQTGATCSFWDQKFRPIEVALPVSLRIRRSSHRRPPPSQRTGVLSGVSPDSSPSCGDRKSPQKSRSNLHRNHRWQKVCLPSHTQQRSASAQRATPPSSTHPAGRRRPPCRTRPCSRCSDLQTGTAVPRLGTPPPQSSFLESASRLRASTPVAARPGAPSSSGAPTRRGPHTQTREERGRSGPPGTLPPCSAPHSPDWTAAVGALRGF